MKKRDLNIKIYKNTKIIILSKLKAIMFLISALTAVVYCSVRSIREVTDLVYYPDLNETRSVSKHIIYFNSWGTSLSGRLLYVIVTVIKNIGTIAVLIVINSMLIIEMKNYYNRKSKLLQKVSLTLYH